MMATHVEEAAQLLVRTADDDDRLAAGELAGDIVARRTQLIEAAGVLPASPKDRVELELQHARIGVPRRGDGRCAFERRISVVEVEDLLHHPGEAEYNKQRVAEPRHARRSL